MKNVLKLVQSELEDVVRSGKKLGCIFYQTGHGKEPVRDWLTGLDPEDKKKIGIDIKAVQFGWPLGLPLVDHIEGEIWEVRTKLNNRIARILFFIDNGVMVLLHGFIKKTKATPEPEKRLARQRLKKYKEANHGT